MGMAFISLSSPLLLAFGDAALVQYSSFAYCIEGCMLLRVVHGHGIHVCMVYATVALGDSALFLYSRFSDLIVVL